VNCILTRGYGKMEKHRVDIDGLIASSLRAFITAELR
jgi:hypothetical protein